ncbi:rod-binding protein [Devosia sp. ZB163]|uniref:rod-binding protein n=1 Tax=Devosia sp. ZB163 TaxID=3025938 RepID=UPI00235EDE73|nr:rod-binding protein [Devosia sp. ZB163]MDC9824356.1 rod-binding protein [Devosia sp. ZB163]
MFGPAASATTTTAGSSLAPAKLAQLREQAEELEGVFLNTLMKEMFASLKTDQSALGGGFGEETWRGMQAEQMANAVAKGGGIGIAESILPDLIAAQEAAQKATTTRGAM